MPTNEAMEAAKYLHHHAWMDEDGILRVPGGTAETIDRETHLPALLAVAEAAREALPKMYETTDYCVVCGNIPREHDKDCPIARMSAALANLPKETSRAD